MAVTQINEDVADDQQRARDADQKASAKLELDQRQQANKAWLKSAGAPAKQTMRLAGLTGILGGLLAVPQAFLISVVIVSAVMDEPTPLAPGLALAALLGIFAARAGLSYAQTALGFRAATLVKDTVRQRLMAKLAATPPVLRGPSETGGLSSQLIEQVEALEGYFARYLPQMTIVMVLPVLFLLVVFPTNWLVGVLLLVTAPLIPLFMALIGMGAAKKSAEQFRTMTRMSGYFLDRLQNIPTLKLFGQSEAELDRIKGISTEFRKRTMSVLRIAFLSSAVLEFFSALSIAMVALYIGLTLLNLISFGPHESITLLTGLFLLLLAPDYFLPLRQLAGFYHDRASAMGAAESLRQIDAWSLPEARSPRQADSQAQAEPVGVSLQNISVVYRSAQTETPGPGSKPAVERPGLAPLSAEISPGSLAVFMGPSGAGKSTLFNVLLGHVPATTGSIKIGAQAHQAGPPPAGLFAWVGQRAHLFHGTVEDNLRLARPTATLEEMQAAADLAQAAGFIEALPKGYAQPLGEGGKGLSGGQIQRLALARAFLSQAPILLLDEPTAHLDRENEALIIDALKAAKGRYTILIATHSEAVAGLADQVIPLKPARLYSEPSTIKDETEEAGA